MQGRLVGDDSGSELRDPRKVDRKPKGRPPHSNAPRRCQALISCQMIAIKSGRQLILRPGAFEGGKWIEEEQDVLVLLLSM